MDAYSISYTTPSRRNSSKLYQDLQSFKSFSTRSVRETTDAHIMENISKKRTPFTQDSEAPHVGIIGGGISGLRCAAVLLKHDFRVTILEGRSRLGGRIHQKILPGTDYLIDTGANWIHGTEDNPILDIANKTGTLTHFFGMDGKLFDEHGDEISKEESEELGEIMWGIVLEAFKHSNANCKDIPEDVSLFDFFQERVKINIPETQQDWERKRRVALQRAQLWGAFVGGKVENQSLKFFWLEECIDGENLFCASTYKKILDEVSKPAKEDATIMYSTCIRGISSHVQAESASEVVLTTVGNEQLKFDEVVVTTPLGWLKKNQDAFSPQLPMRFSNAINNLGWGSLEKVFFSFPKAFWLSKGDRDRSLGFSQWLAPDYDPLNPNRWTVEIMELASLPGNAQPTLLCYVFGDQSNFLSSELSKLTLEEEKKAFLVSHFSPYYSKLPGFSISDSECTPVTAYFTDWVRDDLAGNGSYSNFPIKKQQEHNLLGSSQDPGEKDVQALDEDIETIREGLPGRGVWFAGEHTSPFVALGTVTGAWWSGEGVARRLAAEYGVLAEEKVKAGATVQGDREDSGIAGLNDIDGDVLRAEGEGINVRGFSNGLEK